MIQSAGVKYSMSCHHLQRRVGRQLGQGDCNQHRFIGGIRAIVKRAIQGIEQLLCSLSCWLFEFLLARETYESQIA